MLIPELQEFHRLFAQMDILKQKLIRFWSRDTLICDNVLGSGSPTPPGVEFWKTKIRFYPPGHRKNEKKTTSNFAGSPFYYVKMQILSDRLNSSKPSLTFLLHHQRSCSNLLNYIHLWKYHGSTINTKLSIK